MNSELILFGIKSVIRFGKSTDKAIAHHIADKPLLFPDFQAGALDKETLIGAILALNSKLEKKYIMEPDPEKPDLDYSRFYDSDKDAILIPAEEQDEFLLVLMKEEKAKLLVEDKTMRSLEDAEIAVGKFFVEQWTEKNAPLSPFIKVGLTVADIALEYIGNDPKILGIGGNTEKILGALAQNISDLIPDNDNFGAKYKFAERLVSIATHAALKTVADNPEWLVSQSHVQELVKKSLEPVIEVFGDSNSIAEKSALHDLTDAFVGPALSAALKVVAEKPSSFLGEDFDNEKAIGALMSALLNTAAESGVREAFTDEGLISLYTAAVSVFADKPALFLGKANSDLEKMAEDLLKNVATVLKESPPPFKGDLAAKLGASAIKAVGRNVHRFIDGGKPWEKLAGDLANSIIGNLSKGLENAPHKPLEKLFSSDHLLSMGKIILEQITATPAMVVGHKSAVETIVKSVAAAMAKDEKLLLSGDDWIEIVKVATHEAAQNPGRLFGLDKNNDNEALAADMLSVLLSSASKSIASDNKTRMVLYGQTLREAINILITAASGSPDKAKENLKSVEELADGISKIIEENSGLFGSKEWLFAFRKLLMNALHNGQVPTLTKENFNSILKGEAV